MARKPARAPLNVFLNGRLVGVLRRQSSGAIDFHYETAWLSWENALPVSLSMPLREDRYIGEPVRAVFENLLPDNETLRRQMAGRVGAPGTDAFSLLSVIGRDCVGALQFLPEGVEPGPAGAVRGKAVSEEEIARLLGELSVAPLGLGEDQDFRISLAGAQEKTALLYHEGRWHKPLGTTATTHILKPQIGRLPNGLDLSRSVENEYLCLKLVKALGLESADVQIETFGESRVLVVERFDRLWTRDGRLLRLPQEDCCQALSVPPTLKYDAEGGPGVVQIINLLKGSDTPAEDITTFLKAQIAFWLLGATDGHAKNFSLFLSPGGRYRLAPLYDVLSAEPSFQEGHIRRNQMKLAMAIGDKRHYRLDEIAPRHFVQSAARAGLRPAVILPLFAELAERMPAAVEEVRNALPADFPGDLLEPIEAGMQARLKRVAEAGGS